MDRLQKEINEEQLIEEVKRFPELWNNKLQIYRNLRNKDAAWIRISERMGYTIEELRTKWKALRDKYVREKKIITSTKVSGSGRSCREVWELFQHMEFLKDTVKPKATTSNMTVAGKTANLSETTEPKQAPLNQPSTSFVVETDIGDDFQESILPVLQDEERNDDKSNEGSSNFNDGSDISSSNKTNSSNGTKRSVDSDFGCGVNENGEFKKKKQPKKDQYEQTLLKIWRENSEKINSGCKTPTPQAINYSANEMFMLSLVKDLDSLKPSNQRKVKKLFMSTIDELLVEEEQEKNQDK